MAQNWINQAILRKSQFQKDKDEDQLTSIQKSIQNKK